MQEGSTGPQEESTREESWEGSTDGGESFTDQQDGWGGFLGESEGWDSQQREEGDSVGESKGWNGHKGGVRAGMVCKTVLRVLRVYKRAL